MHARIEGIGDMPPKELLNFMLILAHTQHFKHPFISKVQITIVGVACRIGGKDVGFICSKPELAPD